MKNYCINCDCKLTALNETYPLWNKTNDKLCSRCRKRADFFLSKVHSQPSALDFFHRSREQLAENDFWPHGIQHLEEYCKHLDNNPVREYTPQDVNSPDNNSADSGFEAKASENTVAKIFSVIAYITFIIGFIFGFIAIFNDFMSSLIIWASSFVSGMVFIGFAEIIKLLQKISDEKSDKS